MTKTELIAEVAARASLAIPKAEAIVDAVSEEIIDALVFDSFVYLDGIGIFWSKREQERRGRNPKTGEEIVLEAKCLPTFTSGTLTEYAKNAGHRILTAQDLAENLARKYAFDQSKSLEAINTYIEILIERMNRDEKIIVPGLGTFDSFRYPARSLKDPDTNEVFSTEQKKNLQFPGRKSLFGATDQNLTFSPRFVARVSTIGVEK